MSKRRALLIGNGTPDHPANHMAWCALDARMFREVLADGYGFRCQDIRVLCDGQSTRRNVISSLHWLLADAGPDDRCVLYFSGLGHRVPAEGTLREVLALYDGSLLYDNEVAFLAKHLKPGVLTIVLDTCFQGGFEQQFELASEGAAKAWRPQYTRAQLADYKQRFARVTAFKPFGMRKVACAPSDIVGHMYGACNLAPSETVAIDAAILKACRNAEVAAAGNRRTHQLSPFSVALCSVLAKAARPMPAGWIVDAAGEVVTALGFAQTPHIAFPASWQQPVSAGFFTQEPLAMQEPALSSVATTSPEIVSASLIHLRGNAGRSGPVAPACARLWAGFDQPRVGGDPALLRKFGLSSQRQPRRH